MYSGRPDKTLVVKCSFNERLTKRITFASARNCNYDLLKAKVEQCFSLTRQPYFIAYKDDDGEVCFISSEQELTEAIQYFQAGNDDQPISSAASILSGRSFGRSRITLRVDITVEYDGPSLSDTSSLVSVDEYKGRNGSELSFSVINTPSGELEDDAVTVSSRDALAQAPSRATSGKDRASRPSSALTWDEESLSDSSRDHSVVNGAAQPSLDNAFAGPSRPNGTANQSPSTGSWEDVSSPFEQLKLREQQAEGYYPGEPSGPAVDRGRAWLKEQNVRAMKTLLGKLPELSDSDGSSIHEYEISEPIGGDLALHRDPRGKYYYSYTSGSASQSHECGYDDAPSVNDRTETNTEEIEPDEIRRRPTSMQLNWLQSQQVSLPLAARDIPRYQPSYSSDPLPSFDETPEIPLEVLQFLPLVPPLRETLTDCSSCGVILDSIRYVCSTCGEKKPVETLAKENSKGKARSSTAYTLSGSHSSIGSRQPDLSTSPTLVGIGESSMSYNYPPARHGQKPLPSLPSSTVSLSQSPTLLNAVIREDTRQTGYELCSGCIESAGVNHALEVNLAPGSSPRASFSRGNSSPTSPEETQMALSEWRRTAPGKGKLRHAYLEKVWSHKGWEDVEQDDLHDCKCSTCTTVIVNKRYKCASCKQFNLCRACYSQVHEVHPSHAFLLVPDKPARTRSEPGMLPRMLNDSNYEQSLKHPGVKCAHCMLDIVGARFHCAVCESIDICSNCESAGLPGNLDSSEGGHNSSHIMIKIPYPLETNELRNASRRAMNLWTGRDAATVQSSQSRPSSANSSYARTVVGSNSRGTSHSEAEDHDIACNGCAKPIIGSRFQCACCPSLPTAYNLCSSCEVYSYALHDPMHIFLKIPRPLDKPIEFTYPLIPKLYKGPVGPQGSTTHPLEDPRAYLQYVLHTSALCDRCMVRIQGEWFHCAYCSKDLCDSCEALDTHDDKHVFVVFKAPVDMHYFRMFADLENPNGSPPVLPHPVYH